MSSTCWASAISARGDARAGAGEAGFEVTLASGGAPVEGYRVLQLPPASSDARFKQLLDENGKPVDEAWKRRRREALLEAYRGGRAGCADRGALSLRPAADALRAHAAAGGKRRARLRRRCSVRDLIQPKPEREEETLECFERYFDRLLVHGDPRVAPFERSFGATPRLAGKLHYTGYVVQETCQRGQRRRRWRSAGIRRRRGGRATAARDGDRGASADLAARSHVAGPRRRQRRRPRRIAPRGRGVIVERSRSDFTQRLRNCVVSVSQAGYNTVLETLQAGARSVLVPFAGGGESEQTLRASLLAEGGWSAWWRRRRFRPRRSPRRSTAPRRAAPPAPGAIDLGGARRSAELAARVAGMSWTRLEAELSPPRDAGRPARSGGATTMPRPCVRKRLLRARLFFEESRFGACRRSRSGRSRELFGLLHDGVTVLQHGTDHRNRAAPGEKKTEYPAAEPVEAALARVSDGSAGCARLPAAVFPVLAPPWNRVRKDLLEKLPAIGIRGMSMYGPRASAEPAPGCGR